MLPLSRVQCTILLLAGMIAVIATVLGFQHIGGYIPCKLCLEQREPYYVAIPISAFALLAISFGWPQKLIRLLLVLAGALMLYTVYLAAFHSGVEWGWWPGPTDCGATAGNISSDVGDLLGDLSATQPPSCNEAAGRFLGLSFAGWNVIVSAVLAWIAFKAAFRSSENA